MNDVEVEASLVCPVGLIAAMLLSGRTVGRLGGWAVGLIAAMLNGRCTSPLTVDWAGLLLIPATVGRLGSWAVGLLLIPATDGVSPNRREPCCGC